jgi:sulfite reductase alpha subunit-like flavoprotein
MGERQRILVLYATQTGNAQDVAERVGREAARRHFQPVVESMHLYDASDLPQERFVVFVVSTTGQGDPPETMRPFWRSLLRKSLGHSWLEGTLFAVFGLGDSGYQKYNITGKKLDRRLLDLGGKPVVPRGLGDDQHPSGFEAGLDPWLASLWSALRQHVPLPAGLEDPRPDETGLFPCSTSLEHISIPFVSLNSDGLLFHGMQVSLYWTLPSTGSLFIIPQRQSLSWLLYLKV